MGQRIILIYNTLSLIYVIFIEKYVCVCVCVLGVSKKTDKPIKPRKPKKNNQKKNRINWFKNHKKNSVRFRYLKSETDWTKPNRFNQPALKKKTELTDLKITKKIRFGFGI